MNNPQIMIVEDELIIAQEIQDVLEDRGYDVVHTERSGIEAVYQAEKLKPDLILMDIMLEDGTSGITAAYKINEKEKIPIVFLTGNSDKKTMEEAYQTNPMGYLIKPFDKNKLYATIDNALFRCKDPSNQETPVTVELETMKKIGPDCYQNNFSDNNIHIIENKSTSTPSLKIKRLLEKHDIQLFNTVEKLKAETLSQIEMNKLIEFSCQLAQHRALKSISRLYIANRKWELSIEDIAIEAIASLYVTNKKRNMLNLTYTLLNWDHPIKNDVDAFYFLIKTVHISVDQFINKLLKETDPNFSKILDSVNYCIRKNEYRKSSYIGTVYLVKEGEPKIVGNVITSEEFNNIPVIGNGTEEIIKNMFNYIIEKTSYVAAIPVNCLIRLIQTKYEKEYEYSGIQQCDHVSDIYIDNIITQTMDELFDKLEKSYQRTGKLTDAETFAMKRTLEDIMTDLREGQLNWGLNEYLKCYLPDMTKNDYKEHYQNILDYLFKSLKKSLREKLKDGV